MDLNCDIVMLHHSTTECYAVHAASLLIIKHNYLDRFATLSARHWKNNVVHVTKHLCFLSIVYVLDVTWYMSNNEKGTCGQNYDVQLVLFVCVLTASDDRFMYSLKLKNQNWSCLFTHCRFYRNYWIIAFSKLTGLKK